MKHEGKRRLRNIIAVTLAATILFAAIATGLIYSLSKTHQKEVEFYLQELAAQNVDKLNQQIDSDLNTLQSISVLIDQNSSSRQVIDSILADSEIKNTFLEIAFVDQNGIGAAGQVNGSTWSDVNLSQRKVIQQVLAGHSVISDVIEAQKSGKNILCYAVPVYDNGQLIGALAASRSTDLLLNVVESRYLAGRIGSALIRADGQLLASSSHGRNGNFFKGTQFDPAALDLLEEKIQSAASHTFSFYYDGMDLWGTITPVGRNDWFLVETVTMETLNGEFYSMLGIILLALVPLMLLSIFMLVYISYNEKKTRTRIDYLAYYDPVTGAYNNNGFAQAFEQCITKDDHYTLALLDLCHFKFINYSFGFQAGDNLLRHVKDVLEAELQPDEVVARSNADQFAVLLHTQDKAEIARRVTHMMERISAYQIVKKEHYPINSYCGIKICQTFSETVDLNLLIDRARMAKTSIQQGYGNRYAFFDDALFEKAHERTVIEQRMDSALKNGEFKVYIQPKYDLKTETVCGGEALVRWQREDGSLVSPGVFIPVFEQNGFITKLDIYMLEQVCSLLHHWKRQFGPEKPLPAISLNQSRILFFQENYLEMVENLLNKYQIGPGQIVMEITEGVEVDEVQRLEDIIQGLHKLGVEVSMDDFGSGYSALNVLRELSIDELKLDRMFLMQTENKEKGRAIMESIIQMAKNLSFRTVCEGVETREQAQTMLDFGCDVAQGFYYAKPMPAQDYAALLSA